MLHLARWGYKQDESDGHIRIDIPTNRYNPLRDEQADLDVEALREQYQRGERLAFELLTEARPIGQDTATKVGCRVYLQRSVELEHGHDYFVRGNLRIPKIDHLRNQKGGPCYSSTASQCWAICYATQRVRRTLNGIRGRNA